MRLRLLDLDGSVVAQDGLREHAGTAAQVIDLRREGQSLRLWTSRDRVRDFARRLADEGRPDGKGAEVTFVGSGDYHHLTATLIERLDRPVSVVHFDNHPDWGVFPPAYHCGSWVNRALDLAAVKRIVTIGPCSDDVTWPQLKGANLRALRSGRLELYPWRHAPSRVMGGADGGPHHGRQGNLIRWRNLADQDWRGIMADMVRRLPTDDVYVTVDKDVLDHAEAVTNWNQGEMPLEVVLAVITSIAESKRIVGVDVCGEFATPRFANPFKKLLSIFDQPRPPADPDLSRNAATNLRLLDALTAVGV